MAEEITWINPGYPDKEKAWNRALTEYPPDSKLLANMRAAGIDVQVGIRKKGSKWHAILIVNR